MNETDAQRVVDAILEMDKTNAELAIHLDFSTGLSVAIGLFVVAALWEYVRATWALVAGGIVVIAIGAATHRMFMRTIRHAFRGKTP